MKLLQPPAGGSSLREGAFGKEDKDAKGEKMDENKNPCTPREEAGRDYNELGLYLHGETAKAATQLWEMLPSWMEARRMAFVDPEYNRKMSELIAQLAEPVLKAAQNMAGGGQAESELERPAETLQE